MGVARVGGDVDDIDRWRGPVDVVVLPACFVAVAYSGAAEGLAGEVGDGVIVDQVQPDGTVAGPSAHGHIVGRSPAGAHAVDRCAGDPVGSESKVGHVDAGDVLGERDRKVNGRGVSGIRIRSGDEGDEGVAEVPVRVVEGIDAVCSGYGDGRGVDVVRVLHIEARQVPRALRVDLPLCFERTAAQSERVAGSALQRERTEDGLECSALEGQCVGGSDCFHQLIEGGRAADDLSRPVQVDNARAGVERAVVGPVPADGDGRVAVRSAGGVEGAAVDGQEVGQRGLVAVGDESVGIVDGHRVRGEVACEGYGVRTGADDDRPDVLSRAIGEREVTVESECPALDEDRAGAEPEGTGEGLVVSVAVEDPVLQTEGARDVDGGLDGPPASRAVDGQVEVLIASGEAAVCGRTDILDRAGVRVVDHVGQGF